MSLGTEQIEVKSECPQGFLQARFGGGDSPPPPPKKKSVTPPPKFVLTLFLITLSPPTPRLLPPQSPSTPPPPPQKKGEILQETLARLSMRLASQLSPAQPIVYIMDSGRS